MEPVTEDIRRVMELPEPKGVLINRVFAGSSAEQAGFQQGDVLLQLNNKPVNTPNEAATLVASYRANEALDFVLIRKGKPVTGKTRFRGLPTEQYPDLSVQYTQAKSGNGTQRVIITQPAQPGKRPTIVFIGGYSCYSLDTPLDTSRSETQLINNMARAGYLCARLEKPGMGDGQGQSRNCEEVSFLEEMDGYLQAIRMLKKRPDVDSSAVYVFGHSMGGVMAPLIARQTALKGVIAYGTIGSNFMEYMAKTRRTIAEAYNMPADTADAYIKTVCECIGYYFVEGMTTREATAKNPECRPYLEVFDSRARSYNKELYGLNTPGLWRPYTGKVLLLWGKSDYISARDDHAILEKALNSFHPNQAQFLEVPNATHGMQLASSFQQARTNPGPYNPAVGSAVIRWLQTIEKSSSKG